MNADARWASELLSVIASKLKYTQRQIEAMLTEIAEAYQKDRGQSLINAAFPKVDPDASSHSRNTVET